MKPANTTELFHFAIHIAKGASQVALDSLGVVPPWGFAVIPPDFSPHSVYPRDRMPSASFEELLQQVTADLREIVEQRPEIPAVGTVVTVESGKNTALMVQVETPSEIRTFILPYSKQLFRGWSIGDLEPAEGPFADGVYRLTDSDGSS
jgi:hypothetical protein